jgi:hypothetical protein
MSTLTKWNLLRAPGELESLGPLTRWNPFRDRAGANHVSIKRILKRMNLAINRLVDTFFELGATAWLILAATVAIAFMLGLLVRKRVLGEPSSQICDDRSIAVSSEPRGRSASPRARLWRRLGMRIGIRSFSSSDSPARRVKKERI